MRFAPVGGNMDATVLTCYAWMCRRNPSLLVPLALYVSHQTCATLSTASSIQKSALSASTPTETSPNASSTSNGSSTSNTVRQQ